MLVKPASVSAGTFTSAAARIPTSTLVATPITVQSPISTPVPEKTVQLAATHSYQTVGEVPVSNILVSPPPERVSNPVNRPRSLNIPTTGTIKAIPIPPPAPTREKVEVFESDPPEVIEGPIWWPRKNNSLSSSESKKKYGLNSVNKKGKWWQLLLVGVLLVGAIGMGLSYWQKDQARKETVATLEKQLTINQEKANALVVGVRKEELSRSSAQEQLQLLNNELANAEQQILTLLPSQQVTLTEQVNQARTNLTQAEEKISGREVLSNLAPFYNLKLAQADFQTDRAALIGNQAWFIDDQQKLAISLDPETKSMTKVVLNKAPESGVLTAHNQTNYFQKEDNQLVSYARKADGENGQDKTVSWPNNLEGQAKALTAGANNWYFWQVSPMQIYRQKVEAETPVEKTARGWWTADATRTVDFDFSKISDTTIDNSLWLAQNDGQVFKMTNGAPTKWKIKDLSEPLSGNLRIDTDYNNDEGDLFILAPDQGRVLVVSKKTGDIKRDLRGEALTGASDIFVDPGKNVFYVAGTTEVWQLPMTAQD